MNIADNVLKRIAIDHADSMSRSVSSRDAKVLKNLAKLVDDAKYITKNQANLVLKILSDNADHLPEFREDIHALVETPVWARPFRIVQQRRKIFIDHTLEYPQIIIELTYSAELQKIIVGLSKSVEGFYQMAPGKAYGAALTEKNIVELIDKLKTFKFSVSDELKELYNTIKSWSKTDYEEQYRITTISYPNFEKQIVADLGFDTAIDERIICDRSNRYQYFVKNSENFENLPKNLTEVIAFRKQSKVWVDNTTYDLTEILEAFKTLRRLPTLVVFDTRDSTKCLEKLKKLSESLEKIGITDGVGIYFRLDNDAPGKEFNQFIAEKKFNCHLDHNTKIVGVQSGKIPKFLLKTDWKPMSVVSLDHPLRHSKTAVYASCCDLIITHTESEPIIETRYPWE